MDVNGDDIIDDEGFTVGFAENGVFETCDEGGDDLLSQDELNAGVFGGYDDDDSGAIEEPEFDDPGDDMADGGFWGRLI